MLHIRKFVLYIGFFNEDIIIVILLIDLFKYNVAQKYDSAKP